MPLSEQIIISGSVRIGTRLSVTCPTPRPVTRHTPSTGPRSCPGPPPRSRPQPWSPPWSAASAWSSSWSSSSPSSTSTPSTTRRAVLADSSRASSSPTSSSGTKPPNWGHCHRSNLARRYRRRPRRPRPKWSQAMSLSTLIPWWTTTTWSLPQCRGWPWPSSWPSSWTSWDCGDTHVIHNTSLRPQEACQRSSKFWTTYTLIHVSILVSSGIKW